MKKEEFALENVSIIKNEKNGFPKFTMHVYEEDQYGIICDSIEERNLMISFFSGECEVSGGRIRFENKPVEETAVAGLFHDCFTIIQKKSKLIHTLSISENICIFADKGDLVHSSRYMEQTSGYLEYFHLSLDISKPVRCLTEKERIIVELVKAYAENKKVIVLMDISSFLQNAELEEIHQLVLQIQASQRTFILIEPFGDLIFSWTNKLLVIKDRTDLGCFETSFINRQKLHTFLSTRNRVGHRLTVETGEEEELFQFRNVTSAKLEGVTFNAPQGEILKILCLDMESLEGIRSVILGEEKKYTGNLCFREEEIRIQNVMDMKKRGIAYCRERAYESMVIQNMTVRDNVMMDLSIKVPSVWFFRKYRKNLDAVIEKEIGKGCAGKKLRDLPSFQLQQVVFLKLLLSAPKVIFCEKPFSDMDLHMKEITLRSLEDFRNRGIAVVILTMNLADLNLLDGDDLYLRNGRMIDEDEVYQVLYQV